MRTNALRRAIMGIALAGGALVLVTGPTFAQTPPGPPVCGGVASLMNFTIASEAAGATGDNLLSIPGVSPINNNATSTGPLNGFKLICAAFNLSSASQSHIIQFDAQTGVTSTYNCGQTIPPAWTPGQGAFIQTTEFSGTRSGKIAGVECSRSYSAYARGTGGSGANIYPVPLTVAAANLADLCNQLNLRNVEGHCNTGTNECDAGLLGKACTIDSDCTSDGDLVAYTDAINGSANSYKCGTGAPPSIVLGRGALIFPTNQGICDLQTGHTNVCTRGKVGNGCVVNSDCNTVPAGPSQPLGDLTSTGQVTIY